APGPAHDHALPNHARCLPRRIRPRETPNNSKRALVFAGAVAPARLSQRASEHRAPAPGLIEPATRAELTISHRRSRQIRCSMLDVRRSMFLLCELGAT